MPVTAALKSDHLIPPFASFSRMLLAISVVLGFLTPFEMTFTCLSKSLAGTLITLCSRCLDIQSWEQWSASFQSLRSSFVLPCGHLAALDPPPLTVGGHSRPCVSSVPLKPSLPPGEDALLLLLLSCRSSSHNKAEQKHHPERISASLWWIPLRAAEEIFKCNTLLTHIPQVTKTGFSLLPSISLPVFIPEFCLRLSAETTPS